MGRGSQEQRRLSEKTLDQNKQYLDKAFGERAEGRRVLSPYAESEMHSEGYDEPTFTAMTGRAMEANDNAYGAAADEMDRRAAVTGNTGGLYGGMAQLSRNRAQQKVDTTRDLGIERQAEKTRRRTAGAQLMANLYGVDTNLVGNLLGVQPGLLNAHAAGIAKAGVGVGPFSFSNG